MSPTIDPLLARVGRARAVASMFQRAHVYAMQRAVPERIVIVGDEVQTTWAPWMDAQLRDCERVQAAWIAVVQAVAQFDDDGLEWRLREFEELFHSLVPPVLP